jgi:hypothetical protein
MSLFQEYETKRKPFTAGKKWICVDAEIIGFPKGSKGEIIEIIENRESDAVRYEVLIGAFARSGYTSSKPDIIRGYRPYNGPIE